jgi:hypothetical protein
MNRNIIFGFLGLTLLLGILLWWMESDNTSATKQKNITKNWKTEFKLNSKNPRDLGFFQELLATHTSDSLYIIKKWWEIEKVPNRDSATYIFVGEQFGLEDALFNQLIQHVDSGATMILAFDHVSSNIYSRFFKQGAYYWDYSDRLYTWMDNQTLTFPLVYENDTIYGDWYTFSTNEIKDTNFRAYAYALNEPIAFYQKQGKGKIHFHSVPRLFENYQVLSKDGYAHTAKILNQIPNDQAIVWLKLGDMNDFESSSSNSDEQGEGNEKEDNSLIQYIMKSPPLRMAFLLGIILLLLYVIFRGKRKEEIIAGVPEARNMSIAFVETLSSIYLSKRSPIGVLQVLRKNFFMAVNRHFYIDLTQKDKLEENTKRLIEKSNYDGEKINTIIQSLDPRKNEVNEKHLGSVYRNIRSFYIETGVVKKRDYFVAAGKHIVGHKSILSAGISLLFACSLLVRGLYALAQGGGLGVIYVIIGAILVFISYRILTKPLFEISEHEFTLNGFIWGSKQYYIDQGIQTVVTKNTTMIHFEDGNSIKIQHSLLSRSGKNALAQFVEHLKQLTV